MNNFMSLPYWGYGLILSIYTIISQFIVCWAFAIKESKPYEKIKLKPYLYKTAIPFIVTQLIIWIQAFNFNITNQQINADYILLGHDAISYDLARTMAINFIVRLIITSDVGIAMAVALFFERHATIKDFNKKLLEVCNQAAQISGRERALNGTVC